MSEEKRKGELSSAWRWLLGFAKPYWFLIVLCAVIMLAYSGIRQAPAILLKPLLDDILPNRKFDMLWWLIGIGGGMAVCILVLSFLEQYMHRYVVWRILVDIRVRVCRHLLTLPMRFYDGRKRGDIISRMTNDVSTTEQMLSFLFGDLILRPAMIVAGMAWAFVASWRLALIVTIASPLIVLPLLKYGSLIRRRTRKTLEKLGDVTEKMHQMFSGIKIVKSFGAEEREGARFKQINMEFLRRAMRVVKVKAMSKTFLEFLYVGGMAALIAGGGYLVMTGQFGLTTGALSAFIAAVAMAFKPTRELAKAYTAVQESMAGVRRVFELFEATPVAPDPPGAIPLTGVSSSIEFKNVHFSYDTVPVLVDVNLRVNKGQTLAIVGPSGAGKSTLVDLIPRFYEPQEGAVMIDGIDIRNFTRESLLKNIAIVSQEPFLFNTTIYENISYGKPNSTAEEIIAAAEAANIHEFIKSLPEGYETVVGERGEKLSGGQRQRIAIARALLRNAPILILDEATSSLDTESEKQVQEALNRLMRGRTTLVIAHRLSTIQHADRIIVLDNGRIVESGTHKELMESKGLYCKLYEMQFEGE